MGFFLAEQCRTYDTTSAALAACRRGQCHTQTMTTLFSLKTGRLGIIKINGKPFLFHPLLNMGV